MFEGECERIALSQTHIFYLCLSYFAHNFEFVTFIPTSVPTIWFLFALSYLTFIYGDPFKVAS